MRRYYLEYQIKNKRSQVPEAQTCILATWEAELGRIVIGGQPGK
jgi:hypothetical protein